MNTVEGNLAYSGGRIAIVASRFNDKVVDGLLDGALTVLHYNGVPEDAIDLIRVPGAFELPIAVQRLAEKKQYAGIMAMGAVIKGQTAHFEYICEATTNALMQLGLKYNLPVLYGLLTSYTAEQALERGDVKRKNKGAEVAEALLETLSVLNKVDA